MSNTISVQILGETRGLRTAMRQANTELGGLRSGLGKVGTVMKGVLGAAVIGKITSGVVSEFGKVKAAASDLEQSSGAVEAIFGKSAKGIERQAAGAAKNLGLTKNSYNELASVLGAGLKNQGLKDYAKQTQSVIGLGADLSAQFGGPTKDAVEAIASLMRGEADPIERYGVSIKQSGVNAELAARGQDKLTGAARTQAEAQARLKLLFQQTKTAQGTFARESNTIAGQEQRNAARIENARAKIGTAFLPILVKLQTGLADNVLPHLERFATWAGKTIPGALDTLSAKVRGIFGGGSGGLINPTDALASFNSIRSGISSFASSVTPMFREIGSTVRAVFRDIVPEVQGAMKEIGPIVKSTGVIIAAVWRRVGPIVIPIVRGLGQVIGGTFKGILQTVSGVLKVVSSLIQGDWKGALGGMRKISEGQTTIVKSIFKGLGTALGGIFTGITGVSASRWRQIGSSVASGASYARSTASAAFSSLASTVSARLAAAVSSARAMPGRVVGALSGLGGRLYSAGASLIQGFINGISGSIGSVVAKAREIASSAVAAAKSVLRINSPSKVFIELGKSVGKGFVMGLRGSQASVNAAMKNLIKKATANFKAVADADKRNDLANVRARLSNAKKLYNESVSAAKKYASIQKRIRDLERGGVTKTERSKIRSLEKEAKAARRLANKDDKRRAAVRRAEAALKKVSGRDTGAIALRATDKLLKRYSRQIAAINKNAKARDALNARITKEKTKLSELIKVRNDYAASVRDNARAFADSTKVELGENENLTASRIAQSLRDRLNAIQNFNLKLTQLKKLGLDNTTYNQIVQAGVDGGMATADALLAGGKSAIAEVASIQSGINKATSTLGNTTADTMYKAGIQAQQGLIKGLTKDLSKLDKSAKKMAENLAKAFKKALGIKSPSRVFRGFGRNVTDGLRIGLDADKIARAGRILAGDLVQGFDRPQLDATLLLPGAGNPRGRGGAVIIEKLIIQVPIGATGAQVGRELVGYINDYNRSIGKR